MLWFEFRGLRKGPGRPQKLDFELFRAAFEHFRALFGLENGPPEPPGKQAKTGTGPGHPPQAPRRPRSPPWTKKDLKKSPNQYCFGWTFWCLKMTLQATCLEPLLGGFTVHGSQFTAHDSRLTAHTKNSNKKRLHNTKQQARQHTTTTKQLQQPTTTNTTTTTTLHSYRACLTCSLHDLATTPLSHHAFKKRGRRHGGEAL